MTVANKPGHRGERGGNRKTIARGMPGVSGVTVVTNERVYYTTRGCGRIGRPAFPAPSDYRGRNVQDKLALAGGEIAMLCLKLERRHCEEPTGRAKGGARRKRAFAHPTKP